MHYINLINISLKLFPASRVVNFASFELSGELMQEDHHIWYWNEFKINLDLAFIKMKYVLNLS